MPGCILLKQPGDVVRHLVHHGPTVFTVVTLPNDEVARVLHAAKAEVTPQFEPGDPRAAPFHRLLDAACSGEDRFTLEVALTEALEALRATRSVRSDHSHAAVSPSGAGCPRRGKTPRTAEFPKSKVRAGALLAHVLLLRACLQERA